MTDVDGDGYGAQNVAPGVAQGSDCDDGDSSISPEATETTDGIDNDCNGEIDDVASTNTDEDGDGFTQDDGDCDDSIECLSWGSRCSE